MSLIIHVNNTTYIFKRKQGRPSNKRDYDSVQKICKRGRPLGSKNKPKISLARAFHNTTRWSNITDKAAKIEKLQALLSSAG